MGANSECCGGVELEAAAAAAAAAESGDSTAVLRWERFVEKMAVRVLLVEADDSTHQIITALLRKCGYKVTAVSDGKKAWEVLEKKPHTVDLVLAEIDLPSMSGYTLLTLIMEHEICKTIPVIMMSSQDSVSTVYGCMLRGAADFLVKPIRKNELTNLWQHVWRRQATGSEAQSSCSKSDIDTETENMERIQDLLQPNWDKSDEEDPGQIKSCKEGIDFIGAFDDYINSSSNTTPNNLEFSPALDLSLNQFEDKHRLNHSDGSAFTPYVNKGVQNPGLTFPIHVISPTDSPGKNESDECTHFSSATDQSGNSSLCSGRTQVQVVVSTVECRKEEVPEDRSSQREAALTKFRLKRKDRCYEKKVRYESRKKLAEQRPRVKGQFVRRQPNELMITTAN